MEFKLQFGKYSVHLEENTKKLESVDSSLRTLAGVVEQIKDRQKGFDKELNESVEVVNTVEQRSLDKTIEISGYPYDKDEDTMTILKNIGDAIDYPLSEDMIDDLYRRKPNANFPGILVVSFVRKREKLAFYRAARAKKNLSSRMLGFNLGEPSRVYVNDALTYRNRKLLMTCKEFKRQNGFKFVWVRNGQILMKKDEGASVEVIKSAEALQRISK